MHRKGEFSKIKEINCNFPIEAANLCYVLSTPAHSNGLIVVNKRI